MIGVARNELGRWYVVGLMALGYAVSFIDRALVAVAGAPIKHDLGLSDSRFGLLQGTAFVALYCLCGIPIGWLADRADRRIIIAVGLVFWTLMTAVCGLAHSFGTFFVGRVGVGLGEACLIPAGMSLLASVTPKDRMARSVAIFLMGATVGNIVAFLAGGYILTRFAGPIALPVIGAIAPWRALFLLACPPGLGVAALVMTFREPPRDSVPGRSWRDSTASVAHLLANRRAYGFLTAATACSVTLAQAQAAWIPLLYVRHFGLTSGESATAVGLMFLISAPAGQCAGGLFIDGLRGRGIVASPNVVLALCVALCLPAAVVFCTAGNLRVSEIAYTTFNFLVFAATPAGLTGWQLLTPERYRGILIASLVSIVTLLGVGLGPVVVGLLTDHVFQDEHALGQSLLILILATGSAGCVLAMAGRKSFARSVHPASSDETQSIRLAAHRPVR